MSGTLGDIPLFFMYSTTCEGTLEQPYWCEEIAPQMLSISIENFQNISDKEKMRGSFLVRKTIQDPQDLSVTVTLYCTRWLETIFLLS